MATIVSTNTKESGVVSITETTLTGTLDTFAYKPNSKQRLILRNATTVGIEGVGSIDISGGFSVGSIAAGAVKSINTDSIGKYLAGTIAITGGTGLVAVLMEG